MGRMKREQIEKEVTAMKDSEEQDAKKLELVFERDPIMEEVYKELYKDVKAEADAEIARL